MKFGSTGRLAVAAFAAAAFSVGAYAQDQPGAAGQQRADADRDRDRMVTLTGCVFQEQQVPGRDATAFQRWGLSQQDFVLTNVQTQHAAQRQQPGQTGYTGQQQPGQQQPGQQPGQQQPGQQPGQQQPGQVGQAGQPGQPGQQPAGTAGTGADRQDHTRAGHHAASADNMLKIEGKEAEQLRKYAGQQVEVRGKLDDQAWYERAERRDRDRDRMDTAGRTGTDATGTTGAGVGTTGTGVATSAGTGTGTTGIGTGDRLTSIEVESIRAIGPCPQAQPGMQQQHQQHPRPQQQPSPQP